MIAPGGQANAAGSLPIRPSRVWYWVAGGVLAAAVICIALAVAGFVSVNRQIEDFQRVPVPGRGVVTFVQPGGYVLYVEQPGNCCSLAASSEDSAPLPSWSMRVALVPADGGPRVPVSSWRGAIESYSVSGHEGQTAMYATVSRAGRYGLTAQSVAPGSITDVAVGRGIGHGALIWLLLFAAGLFVLLPAGLAVGGVTAARRRRARRSLQGQLQIVT